MIFCKNCSKDFKITDEDRSFYKKMDVPEPTWCPSCRHLRRHGHINDYTFFTRSCDHCKKSFVSIFPPDSKYTVICQTCWFSEERDDKARGRDYDFSRSFFDQYNDLLHAAPQLGIIGSFNENCDYCESVANCRNCYLISESSNCESCLFCYWIQKCKDCLECNYCHECERCYELENCFNCFNLKYSQNSSQCSDSAFLDNCVGCKNSLFSTNLRHKKFYIFNQPYSKEDFFKEWNKLAFGNLNTVRMLKEKFQEFLKTQPRRALQNENIENCTGDYIRNAKNCHDVFHCYDAEECAYGEHVWRGAKYCYDSNTAGREAELLYETTNSGIESYSVKFCRYCWGSKNTEYSNTCFRGSDLFGCVSLKPGAKYCILNKEYSEAEYKELVAKIKSKMLEDGEYGEFFPLSISLFGYNTTPSYDDHPFTRDEVLGKGWKWEDQTSGIYHQGTLEMISLPADIQNVNEDILKEVLTCQDCEKNYKVIRQEFDFYKRETIPLPRRCTDCRLRNRLKLHHKETMFYTSCANCQVSVRTTFSDPTDKVYCEPCYLKEVY